MSAFYTYDLRTMFLLIRKTLSQLNRNMPAKFRRLPGVYYNYTINGRQSIQFMIIYSAISASGTVNLKFYRDFMY